MREPSLAKGQPSRASASRRSWLLHPLAKPVFFLASLLPVAWLLLAAATDRLGANPTEALIRGTGDWALRFLCLALAITPLRVWAGQPAWARLRRMVGLFAFFYACLHFLSYAGFDKEWALNDIGRDILKRPFILVGSAALLGLLPLAATSFNRAIKAMGARRWQALHRLVYGVALLGLLHFFWMRASKNNLAEVAWYAGILALLLGWRVFRRMRPSGRP